MWDRVRVRFESCVGVAGRKETEGGVRAELWEEVRGAMQRNWEADGGVGKPHIAFWLKISQHSSSDRI